MVYLDACLIAGIRLARKSLVHVRVVPTSRAIEESVELAHEISIVFSGEYPQKSSEDMAANAARNAACSTCPGHTFSLRGKDLGLLTYGCRLANTKYRPDSSRVGGDRSRSGSGHLGARLSAC